MDFILFYFFITLVQVSGWLVCQKCFIFVIIYYSVAIVYFYYYRYGQNLDTVPYIQLVRFPI